MRELSDLLDVIYFLRLGGFNPRILAEDTDLTFKVLLAGYKPVLEAFESFAQENEDARSILNKLMEQFSIRLIHNSLVDLVEHEYLDEKRDRLVAIMLELLHKEEGLPPCAEYRCKLEREKLNESSDDGNTE